MGRDGVGSGKVRHVKARNPRKQCLPPVQRGYQQHKVDRGKEKVNPRARMNQGCHQLKALGKKRSVESYGVRWISGWMDKLAFMLTLTEISLEWGGAY